MDVQKKIQAHTHEILTRVSDKNRRTAAVHETACCTVLHYEHSVLISWLPSGVCTVKVTVGNWSYSGVHYVNTN